MASAGRFAAWHFWLKGGATASQLGGRTTVQLLAVQAERAISRLTQKLRVYECAKQRLARLAVETPQALRLRWRQPQTGHLQVLALDPSQGSRYGYISVRQGHARAPAIE
jgi:hypothetical protein